MKRQNYSSKRAAILNAVRSTEIHPSAMWIYENLREDYPNISLGTVYRNIALLREQGLVNSVAMTDGEIRVDGNTAPHAHFVCSKCKRVFDLHTANVPQADIKLDGMDCSIDSVSLTYHGICGACKK